MPLSAFHSLQKRSLTFVNSLIFEASCALLSNFPIQTAGNTNQTYIRAKVENVYHNFPRSTIFYHLVEKFNRKALKKALGVGSKEERKMPTIKLQCI